MIPAPANHLYLTSVSWNAFWHFSTCKPRTSVRGWLTRGLCLVPGRSDPWFYPGPRWPLDSASFGHFDHQADSWGRTTWERARGCGAAANLKNGTTPCPSLFSGYCSSSGSGKWSTKDLITKWLTQPPALAGGFSFHPSTAAYTLDVQKLILKQYWKNVIILERRNII